MRRVMNRNAYRTNMLLLLQGHFVSKLGTAVFDIAIVLWMTSHSVTASVIGLVMMAAQLPEIVLSPLSGSIVDMTSRKKVLVASDLVSGLIIVGIGAACLFGPDRTSLQFGLIVSGAICIGVSDSFFNPAVSSFIPELTPPERLQGVNSLYRFLTTAATFLGQFTAGMLFAALGAPVLFVLNGLSYLFSSASESFIVSPWKEPGPNEAQKDPFAGLLRNLREGLAYIREQEELRNFLLILCLYHFFISPFTVILPFYVSDVLKTSPAWYGYFMAAFGVGLMIGFMLAGLLKPSPRGQSVLTTGCLGISAAGYLFIGLFPYAGLTAVLILMIGTAIAMIVVTLNTIIQLATPNAIQGRIFGLYHTLSAASIPLGMGFFGVALDLLRPVLPDPSTGPAVIFQFCGAVLLLIVAVYIRKPSFRRFLTIQAERP